MFYKKSSFIKILWEGNRNNYSRGETHHKHNKDIVETFFDSVNLKIKEKNLIKEKSSSFYRALIPMIDPSYLDSFWFHGTASYSVWILFFD